MFIRENRNRNGFISFQVIEKIKDKNMILFSAGVAENKHEVEKLKFAAQEFIDEKMGLSSLFISSEDDLIEQFITTLTNQNLRFIGLQLVLYPIFEKIYPCISKPYFKELVLRRVIYQGNKLRTVEYLSRHFYKEVSTQTIKIRYGMD